MLQEMFCLLEGMWKWFLDGCRPYLAIGATSLTGKFRGHVASACALDAHNWDVDTTTKTWTGQ